MMFHPKHPSNSVSAFEPEGVFFKDLYANITAKLEIEKRIDSLAGGSARWLIEKIKSAFPSIKPFVEVRYPSAVSAKDADGRIAKELLKRMLKLTAKTSKDIAKWRAIFKAMV